MHISKLTMLNTRTDFLSLLWGKVEFTIPILV